jgi:subfamily B ATP-binding cassette protein MsbA
VVELVVDLDHIHHDPPIALVVRAFNRRLRGLTRQTQQAMGDVNHVLQESMENQKVVKVFGGQSYEVARFGKAVNQVRRLLMKEQTAAAANCSGGSTAGGDSRSLW